jgi:hypothetical protein
LTRFNVSFDPVLPWPLIASLGALLAIILVVLAWQHVRGTALRAIASALLVLALTNPVLKREERDPLPGIVALVVDESASQRLGKRSQQTEKAVAQLKQRLAALGGFQVREVHAADRPDGNGTELFSELTKLVDDLPPEQIAGALLVTDGIVADVPDNPAALGFNAPIHALVTGEENEHDRRIVLDRAALRHLNDAEHPVSRARYRPPTRHHGQRQAQGGRDRGGKRPGDRRRTAHDRRSARPCRPQHRGA